MRVNVDSMQNDCNRNGSRLEDFILEKLHQKRKLNKVLILSDSQSSVGLPLMEKLSLCEYLMNMLRIFCELHCSQ